jgi:hypothetical protein
MVDEPMYATVETPADGTVVMLCRLAFEPNEAERVRQGSVKITLRFGAPVVERVVEASWPGSH